MIKYYLEVYFLKLHRKFFSIEYLYEFFDLSERRVGSDRKSSGFRKNKLFRIFIYIFFITFYTTKKFDISWGNTYVKDEDIQTNNKY